MGFLRVGMTETERRVRRLRIMAMVIVGHVDQRKVYLGATKLVMSVE